MAPEGGGKTDPDEIYDRYEYLEEKRDALGRLESHLRQLFKAGNVPLPDQSGPSNGRCI